MPGLARKLLICAAVDGLVIQPLATKSQQNPPPPQQQQQQQRPPQPIKVKYGDSSVSSVPRDQIPDISRPNSSFEAFGIIGLFTVSRLSYLISITGREQVAQVRGFPVYVVTDVALTPCTSQTEAEKAISHTAIQLRRAVRAGKKTGSPTDSQTESDSESETDDLRASINNDVEDPGLQSDRDSFGEERDGEGKRSSIAEDVIKNRGSYGRFAQKWFSRKGWMMNQKRNLLLSGTDEEEPEPSTGSRKEGADDDKDLSKQVVNENVGAPSAPSAGESLLPKLLRMAHIWFGTSRSFFFSYDVDLTRSLAARAGVPSDAPLHRQADPTFFWNRVLLKPFLNSTDESLLLPIMQGFVGQRSFVVDRDPPQLDSQQDSMEMNDMTPRQGSPADPADAESSPTRLRQSEREFLITVISRRSTKRAGLRYLRRGVDDQGYTANFVETEQLLSASNWEPASKTFSFVQVRGSIPLFFTQSPYSLKPSPVLQHSAEANFQAFKNHFHLMGRAYGPVQLVNLVERRGVEAIIGNEYEKNAERFNEELGAGDQPLAYEWFDFHHACRGMKFENISLLLDTLGKKIEAMGSTVERDGRVVARQDGVLRTNCMDCLDRTNVCQSSFARFVLESQLREEGFDMGAQPDQQNTWFNTLWADNGDAISKQYASTAAMKGDYTRTRKRDYRGMVNDLGLSLTRFYNGMVNDYFSQAAIDFFLGNVTSMVFDEFESTMMTKDPAVSMQRMREQAIETSQKIAIEDPASEDFIGGWTLLSPRASSSSSSPPSSLEEVVLLLTDAALYLCRFDWKLDKVQSFERVDLAHIVALRIGTYITSTISPADIDERKNVGLLVTYQPGARDVVRTNTRSLSNMAEPEPDPESDPASKPNPNSNADKKEASDVAPTPIPAAAAGILSAISSGGAGSGGGDQQRDVEKSKAKANKTKTNTKTRSSNNRQARSIALKAPYTRTALSEAAAAAAAEPGEPPGGAAASRGISEQELVNVIAGEIERLVLAATESVGPRGDRAGSGVGAEDAAAEGDAAARDGGGSQGKAGPGAGEDRSGTIIERGDIISLVEAKRSTGILEQLGHSIKKLVWA